MSKNWKPGDVAMADGPGYKGIVFHHFDHESRSNEWMTAKEGGYYGVDIRRLVVIDPEDREQVERLSEAYLDWFGSDLAAAAIVNAMQAALREFANPTPPKPEEPTGLGAVVEAICGCNLEAQTFVRNEHVDPNDPWEALCGWHVWPDLKTVVRVLSEGVTP